MTTNTRTLLYTGEYAVEVSSNYTGHGYRVVTASSVFSTTISTRAGAIKSSWRTAEHGEAHLGAAPQIYFDMAVNRRQTQLPRAMLKSYNMAQPHQRLATAAQQLVTRHAANVHNHCSPAKF